MPESTRAKQRVTLAALRSGRDNNLDLASAIENTSLPCSGGRDPGIADRLPRDLRSAAERLNRIIDYMGDPPETKPPK